MVSESQGALTCNCMAIYVRGLKLIEIFHRYGRLWSPDVALELVEVHLFHYVYGVLCLEGPDNLLLPCSRDSESVSYAVAGD